jgi:hypothetical protein
MVLIISFSEGVNWREATWLYDSIVPLLNENAYRRAVLTGLVLSIGSKTNSTVRSRASHQSYIELIHSDLSMSQLQLRSRHT